MYLGKLVQVWGGSGEYSVYPQLDMTGDAPFYLFQEPVDSTTEFEWSTGSENYYLSASCTIEGAYEHNGAINVLAT